MVSNHIHYANILLDEKNAEIITFLTWLNTILKEKPLKIFKKKLISENFVTKNIPPRISFHGLPVKLLAIINKVINHFLELKLWHQS